MASGESTPDFLNKTQTDTPPSEPGSLHKTKQHADQQLHGDGGREGKEGVALLLGQRSLRLQAGMSAVGSPDLPSCPFLLHPQPQTSHRHSLPCLPAPQDTSQLS